jgi:hypothetical protein
MDEIAVPATIPVNLIFTQDDGTYRLISIEGCTWMFDPDRHVTPAEAFSSNTAEPVSVETGSVITALENIHEAPFHWA